MLQSGTNPMPMKTGTYVDHPLQSSDRGALRNSTYKKKRRDFIRQLLLQLQFPFYSSAVKRLDSLPGAFLFLGMVEKKLTSFVVGAIYARCPLSYFRVDRREFRSGDDTMSSYEGGSSAFCRARNRIPDPDRAAR